MMKNNVLLLMAMILVSLSFGGVLAQEGDSVCCEQTVDGFYCQDTSPAECSADARQVPTSCESTSFCKGGYCFDSTEGTCLENTPQNVCNAEGGIWSAEFPPQCSLGCCVLGDQASFVTQTRCKQLSGFLGLQTKFDKGIVDEVQCVLSVANQDKGACVYDLGDIKTCEFTTRANCGQNSLDLDDENVSSIGGGEFFEGKLCSADELNTICGPTRETSCVEGKDEIYFVDSCGNPANIYDASKVDDKEYWTNLKTSEEVCQETGAGCGNCDYLSGSICRPAERGDRVTYGENVCRDLSCYGTRDSIDTVVNRLHGESWCVYSDEGEYGEGAQAVGSRFYRHLCINGEEVVESCADFRNEICIEDSLNDGDFGQAGCRVNRWQDCLVQEDQLDCENEDRRDCIWDPDALVGEYNEDADNETRGLCVPRYPPGSEFWNVESEIDFQCSQINTECEVVWQRKKNFEVGELFSDPGDLGIVEGEWECVKNCECLDDSWWEESYGNICIAMGDCGPNINWQGEQGYRQGFSIVNETRENANQAAAAGEAGDSGGNAAKDISEIGNALGGIGGGGGPEVPPPATPPEPDDP